jgi:chromatin segregation and condensation protein Rec8/ScpA/Scc1 (kleisin family)
LLPALQEVLRMPKLLCKLPDKFLKKVYRCGYRRLRPEESAKYLGISVRTFFRYQNRFLSFREALEAGKKQRRDDDLKKFYEENNIDPELFAEMEREARELEPLDLEITPKPGYFIEERIEQRGDRTVHIIEQRLNPLPDLADLIREFKKGHRRPRRKRKP